MIRKPIKRNLGRVECLAPGEYTTETRDEKPAIRCSGCGGISEIEFDVHDTGAVSQIWSCPYVSCAFVAYLTLENWREEVAR